MECKIITFIAVVVGLLNLTACNAGPCRLEVNGICYDRPKASNPPLSARFEAIDADTGKPLPGVMISFYWKTFLPSGQPDQCARNVIGETDAQGKFANTGKDGSWMFTQVQMFKSGWERIGFDRVIGQTYISHKYQLNVPEIGMYPAWESNLKRLGYELDTKTMGPIYRKKFELGGQYQKIMTAEWQPEGLRTYWVKMRGFPGDLVPSQVGTECYDLKLQKIDPDAESVGYALPKFSEEQVNLQRFKHAIGAICDEKWDSVPVDFVRAQAPALIGFSAGVFGNDQAELVDLLPDFYGEKRTVNSNFSRALTKAERIRYCGAVYKKLENSND